MRSSERLTVPIVLSRTAQRPLHEQLIEALRRAIDTGLLPVGCRLPSTRTMAEVLGISRGVATAAYERLQADGTIHGTPGSGTYVSARATTPVNARLTTVHGGRDQVDLRPGRTSTEDFPLAAWRSAWRQASHDPPPPGYPPGRGLAALRAAVAEHVRRVHGYACADRRVVITSGPRRALEVLLGVVRADGGARCALADPGPRWLRGAVAANGVAVPIPLDTEGMRVDRLPGGIDVVLAALEDNAPMGVGLSLDRREQLARWAQRTGGWLVELVREVRTDRLARPLPSLLTLGPPRRTALLGDLGELLTPALGLGYLVLPPHLADAAARWLAAGREQPALLNQRAAAELFRNGSVARRGDQLAAIHARKLAVVRDVLAPLAELRDTRVAGTAAVLLPDAVPVDGLIGHCGQVGVLLCALHESYARPEAAPNGLLLGFGHLEDTVLCAALHAVAGGIRDLAIRPAFQVDDVA